MRRAIAAAVMGGLVLGGAAATPSVAAARGEGKGPAKAGQAAAAKPRADSKLTTDGKTRAHAKPKAHAKSKAPAKPATGMRTVVYEGYEFQVPASWPVYRLDEHPQTCVRYDVHAVYLGTPGTDMRCAAGLVGQTQTVSFIPGKGAASGPAAGHAGHSAAAGQAGGTELQQLSAVHGTVTQNAVRHKLEVTLGSAQGATVLGTYGTDPGIVEQVLNTLHPAPAGTAPTAQSARAAVSPAAPAAVAAAAQATPAYTTWHGVPAHWPVQIVSPSPSPTPPQPKPQPTPLQPVSGFDTCAAPSTSTMRAWRSVYAAVGVYIGGANAACAQGNLSAGWIQTVAGMGWGVLPTYVGPQAPCWGGGRGVLIDPGKAVAEGNAAAADAISDARAVGLAAGAPIYYDMEAYNGGTTCKSAVLNFLGAWDSQVAAAGFVTGVYSSQASGIVDMQAAAASQTPGFTPPDALWIALWDNVSSLSDGNLTWPLTDRTKQFSGNVNQTIGGITLNIDKDLVGGPVAGGPVDGLRRADKPLFPDIAGQSGPTTNGRGKGFASSREPPWTHKLTTWPYAVTVLTPSST
jgi:hypothetical protein